MKKIVFLALFVLVNATAFPQDPDSSHFKSGFRIGVFTNVGLNQPVRLHRIISMYEPRAFHGSGSYSAGVKFSKALSANKKIEIGAVYSVYKVGYEDQEFAVSTGRVYHETFETFSIPVILNTSLGKNYFLSLGSIIEIAIPRYPCQTYFTDTQSGIGFSIGGGKELNVGNFVLDIAPNLEIHSVLPFTTVVGQQRLLVVGVRLGLINKFL